MSYIFCLIKFTKKEYVEDFLKGNMRFTPIEEYKDYLNREGEKIGDKGEGASAIYQEGKYICIDGVPIEDGLVSATLHINEKIKNKKALCLYAVHSHNFKNVTEENIQEFMKIFNIKGYSVSGNYDNAIIITNGKKFFELIKQIGYYNTGIKQLTGGLVEYKEKKRLEWIYR